MVHCHTGRTPESLVGGGGGGGVMASSHSLIILSQDNESLMSGSE